MMNRMLLGIVAIVLTGCAADRGRYVSADDDFYGRKDRLEYTQKSRVVSEMVEKMMSDPDFSEVYAVAKDRAEGRGHRRPTIVVREIEDNTRAGNSDFLTTSQMRKELKTALRKTKMFAVVDLQERERMVNDSDVEVSGGARNDNSQSVGEYESGDFFMYGELALESVGGRVFYHFFNLRLVDPVTGGEIWSDTVRIGKM